MGQAGTLLGKLVIVFGLLHLLQSFEGVEGTVQYLWYPVPVTPAQGTTFLRRNPGKSVHFQTRNVEDGTYHFGYDADTLQGDKSFREEKRDAMGRVTGSYGYVDPEGTLRVVNYIADHQGYRTVTSNQQPVGLRLYNEPIQVIGPIPRPFTEIFRY